MGRLVVYEMVDERVPKFGDVYLSYGGHPLVSSCNDDPEDKERTILRRLTDEEVAARLVEPPTWTDIWVCSGCGKRSTDIDDTAGLWRWRGDRYEHGCVGEGQARKYEPARFVRKVGQEKPVAADSDRARFIRDTAVRLLPALIVATYRGPEQIPALMDDALATAESLAAKVFP